MSISLRDRRVRIYGYSNSGGEGFASDLYTFREERWASVSQTTGRQVILATAPEDRSDAVFDFDSSVDVLSNDLLIDGDDRYFVRDISLDRSPRALIVKGQKLSREVFSALQIVDWTAPGALDPPTYGDSVLES